MRQVEQRRPLAYRFAEALLRPLMAGLTRREWSGAEHLPESGGFVVTTHHLSYLDPLVVAHYLNDNGRTPHFLGKVEVFQVPVVGAILRSAGQIPVYRETGQAANAYRAAVAAVERGSCVVIYPEGTITRDPARWPMRGKTGAARVALQTRCPVIPVAHWGIQEMLGPYEKRPHLRHRASVQVRAGAPVDLTEFHDAPLQRETLTAATDRIMHAITTELELLRGETAPIEPYDPRAAGQTRIGRPRSSVETIRRASDPPRALDASRHSSDPASPAPDAARHSPDAASPAPDAARRSPDAASPATDPTHRSQEKQ